MPQIIERTPGFGELLGEGLGLGVAGLGTGLGQGLANLAQFKMGQLQNKQQQAQTFNALTSLGIDPQVAQLVSVLPTEIQKNAFSNLGALSQFKPATQSQISVPQPIQSQTALPSQQQSLYEYPEQIPLSSRLNPLEDLQQQNALRLLGISPEMISQQSGIRSAGSPLLPAESEQIAVGKPLDQEQSQLAQTQPENAIQQLSDIFTSPEEKRRRRESEIREEKLQLQKQQLNQKERQEAFKLTKDERKQIADASRAAKEQLDDLNRLSELQTEGKLDTPGYVEFLERSGLNIPALMQEGSEEFIKIRQNFLRNAKQIFGGRITNFEIDQFLKTIPSLSQSPEGRKRVIANLKRQARGALEYNKAMREIIKENNNIPPLDLREQIEDRIDPRLDKIAQQFKEDLKKSVPASQSKLVTALQSTLGTVVGRIPKAAAGAGIGAAAGARYAGIPGAVGGGIVGGLAGLGGLSIKDLI